MSRTVITGTGVISAAGVGAGRILDAMLSRQALFDGTATDNEDISQMPWPAAVVDPANVIWPKHDTWWTNNRKFASLGAHWAVTVACEALTLAPAVEEQNAKRIGVVMALAPGEEDGIAIIPRLAVLARTDPRPLATLLYEEVPDFSYVRGIPSQTGQFIAKATGARGSNAAVYGESSAGGLSALALALRLLDSGELDRVMVVGVAPPLSPMGLVSLDRADTLGTMAVPGRGPFDRCRLGPFIGQGAAAIALERLDTATRRGATPLAELVCCEAICGATLEQAISAAIDLVLPNAGGPPDVWWAHGCGSVITDRIECQAMSSSIRTATTSTKGTIGSAFDCAGLIDVAVAVEALNRDVIPPIGLLDDPDPALGEMDFVRAAPRAMPGMARALITALGHPGSGPTSAAVACIKRMEPGNA